MKKKLITLALVAFGLLVLYDVICQEPPRKLQIDSSPPQGAQVNARLQAKGVRYDLQSHSVLGMFNLYIRAADDRDIDNVAFSPTSAGSREWLAIVAKTGKLEAATHQVGDCQLQLSEEVERNNPISSATFECKDAVMASGSGAEEIWYPFDSYEAVIAPEACINSSNGACGRLSNAQIASINSFGVVIGDQNLVGELNRDPAKPNIYLLALRRRFFVRMVSVIFLILSIGFLIYLGAAGDPIDLLPKSLGFFGALWGLRALIVPSAVTIFPTTVDFSILILFCVLFLLVLRKFVA